MFVPHSPTMIRPLIPNLDPSTCRRVEMEVPPADGDGNRDVTIRVRARAQARARTRTVSSRAWSWFEYPVAVTRVPTQTAPRTVAKPDLGLGLEFIHFCDLRHNRGSSGGSIRNLRATSNDVASILKIVYLFQSICGESRLFFSLTDS